VEEAFACVWVINPLCDTESKSKSIRVFILALPSLSESGLGTYVDIAIRDFNGYAHNCFLSALGHFQENVQSKSHCAIITVKMSFWLLIYSRITHLMWEFYWSC
jgi:hypothetical protein